MKKNNAKLQHSNRTSAPPDADIRELTGLLYATVGRFQVLRRTFARALQLTSSEFAVVMSLHALGADQGIRIRVLAEHIHVAAANCTATVKRLERKGWVTKSADPSDSRALSVKLTRSSYSRLNDFFRTIHPVNQVWFSRITKSDRMVVKRTLSYLIEQYPATLHRAHSINLRR